MFGNFTVAFGAPISRTMVWKKLVQDSWIAAIPRIVGASNVCAEPYEPAAEEGSDNNAITETPKEAATIAASAVPLEKSTCLPVGATGDKSLPGPPTAVPATPAGPRTCMAALACPADVC